MKKLFIAVLVLLAPAMVSAADFLLQNPVVKINENMRMLVINGKGAAPAACTTNTENTRDVTGFYLIKVIADPGAVVPDAADVLVSDTGGEDMLEGDGVNLIHAANTQSIYTADASNLRIKGIPILGAITISVANQGTADALYDITLVFDRISE